MAGPFIVTMTMASYSSVLRPSGWLEASKPGLDAYPARHSPRNIPMSAFFYGPEETLQVREAVLRQATVFQIKAGCSDKTTDESSRSTSFSVPAYGFSTFRIGTR
jgi:hypothetical protein